MALTSKNVMLAVSDGTNMQAYLSRPDDGQSHPGIIVCQEAFGVNSHIKNICDRLAAAGYVAIAPEFFHRTAEAGFTCSYTEFESARPHTSAMTVEGQTADLLAANNFLLQDADVLHDSIGTIGFCMGGRLAFLANIILPLKAAVSYYGGGMAALLPRASEVHAPHLFYWAGLDKNISHEHVQQVVAAMKAAGKEYTNVEFSNTQHGFNCDERAAYDPQAARQSWVMTMRFLEDRLLLTAR